MGYLDHECNDRKGKCFARKEGMCTILLDSDRPCSFKKPDKSVTNGKTYPYNPAMAIEEECPNKQKRNRNTISREQWIALMRRP